MGVLGNIIKGYDDGQARVDTLKDRALQLKQLQEEKARQAHQDAQRLASQALPIELDEANQVDWWNQTDANPSVRGAKQESINAKRRVLGLGDMSLADVRPNEFAKDMLEAQKMVRSGIHPNMVIKQLATKYGDWLNTQSVNLENSVRLQSKDEMISMSNPFTKPKEVAITSPTFKASGDIHKSMFEAYNTGGMDAVNSLVSKYKSAPSTERVAGMLPDKPQQELNIGNIPNPNPMSIATPEATKDTSAPVAFSQLDIDNAISDIKRYDLETQVANQEKKKYTDELAKYNQNMTSLNNGSFQFTGEKMLHAMLSPEWDNSQDEKQKKDWEEEGQKLDQDSLQVDINAHVEKGFANGWYPAGVTREDAFKTGRQVAFDKSLDIRKAKMYTDDVQRRYNGPNGIVKLSEKYTNQAQFDADTRAERYDMWQTSVDAAVASGQTPPPWQEGLYSVKVGMNVKDSVVTNQGQQKINETVNQNDVKHQEFLARLELDIEKFKTATSLAIARANKSGSGGGSGSKSGANTAGGIVYTKTQINTKSGMRDSTFQKWMDSVGINRDAAKAGVVDHGSPGARLPELDRLITETSNADKYTYRGKTVSITQMLKSKATFLLEHPELKAQYETVQRNRDIINKTWDKATSMSPSVASPVFIDFRKTGTDNRPVVKPLMPPDPKKAEENRLLKWATGGGNGAKPKPSTTQPKKKTSGGLVIPTKMGGRTYRVKFD